MWTIFKVFIKLCHRKLEMTEQLNIIKFVVIMFLFHVLGFFFFFDHEAYGILFP